MEWGREGIGQKYTTATQSESKQIKWKKSKDMERENIHFMFNRKYICRYTTKTRCKILRIHPDQAVSINYIRILVQFNMQFLYQTI